jgi:Na+-transporting NADH:ubiquinone oxidoreductase subunit F
MIFEVLVGVLVFTAVIILLVLLLNFVGNLLLPQGEVSLVINDDASKSLKVQTGGTVLSALASQNVYLPSACGGQGTCAQCKCQVVEGGGDILPTEQAYISRKDQKDHWRLGCQVKIRNDMKIKVPDEIFSIRKWDATVKSNNNVATFIKELVIELPKDDPIHFESGGYIQIDVPAYNGIEYKNFEIEEIYRDDWDKFDVWQYTAENKNPIFRAYSMANHPAEGNMIMLNIRIASPPPNMPSVPPGIASSYVFNLKPGDKITVSGPYGDFHIKDTEREMVYIGGGAGMAPLRSHIFHLLKTENTKRKVSFWYGARSVKEMFYDEEFKDLEKQFSNFKYQVALSDPLPNDNWEGPIGFIHQVALDLYLKNHEDPTECEYYLCGPPMMISAVQKMLWDLGVEEDMIAYDDFG